jgi:predicted phosphohydrolase
MTKSLSWIHISDLHIRSGDQYDQNVVIDSLLADITHLVDKYGPPDLIFLTGDVAFSGNVAEYERGVSFISHLISASGTPLDRLFLVPGNHDVDRSKFTPFIEAVPLILNSREMVSDFIGRGQELSLLTQKLQNYNTFIKNRLPWCLPAVHNLAYTANLDISSIRVAVIGLNSAWLGGKDDEKGKLVIGERQLSDALDLMVGPDVVIALTHHPPSHLKEFDASDVQNLLNRRCDFVLHGHLHEMGVVNLVTPDSAVYYLAAGASYVGRREILNYNHIYLNLDEGTAAVHLRKYDDRTRSWHYDSGLYENAPCGVLEFLLPERLSHRPERTDIIAVTQRIVALRQEPLEAMEPELPSVPVLPDHLIEAVLGGKCVLFAGAGASMDAKLPGWPELVRLMVEEVVKAGTADPEELNEMRCLLEQKDYLILSAHCKDRLGNHDFTDLMKRQLTDQNRISTTHRLLSQVPFRAAITSNFDLFLEHYRDRAQVILPDLMEALGGVGVAKLLDDKSVFPIIKIHGSLEAPHSLVITQSDFQKVLFARPKYKDFLVRLLTDTTIFFYGYSFRDPHLDFVLQEIMSLNQGYSHTHYALTEDPGKIKRRYIQENYNIRVIPYRLWKEGHTAATAFLQLLVDRCGQVMSG